MSIEAVSVSDNEQSSISVIISTIKKDIDPQGLYNNLYQTALKNHIVGLNEYRKVIYVEAEINGDSLDHGSDIEEIAQTIATENGESADRLRQLIGKQLGGPGVLVNVYPVNSLIIHEWKKDEEIVYSHVKKENCSALLVYGLKYDDEENLQRPSDIYYQFKFFENGQPVGDAIEKHMKNENY